MTDGVPLREALKLPPLKHARVVAGAVGLDRVVRYVNVMEVPDILAWVKPDQLLLTTTYPLRDERAALAELVPRLAERGLAGLAIKPARYVDAIPQVMLESADQLAFPLLELPLETSFDDIINSVLGVILNAQALRLQRSAAIHDRFTQIVLSGGGLREIVRALGELIGCPAAILDAEGTVLARSADAALRGLGAAELPGLPSPPSESPRLQWVRLGLPEGPRAAALQPIQVGLELHGALVALAEEGGLGEEELVALEHAATVAALQMVQARAVAETDRRFKAVCLEELVSGHLRDRSLLRERAIAFGWELSVPRAVMVAELEEVGGRRLAQLAGTPEEGQASHRLAEAAAATLGRDAILWERSAGIAALVAPGPRRQAELSEAAARLQAEARRRLPEALVAIGIGRLCSDPLELHRSHVDALRALVVGRRARGPGQISIFEDLGLDRLLMSCPDGELSAYYEATLGRLAAYDAVHRADLVSTLETFLACNRNAALAARSLFVHYNTLKHRLDRIEEILGPFVGDSERCLSLDLALRIRRLLAQ